MILKALRSIFILFLSIFVIFVASRLILRSLPGDPIETMIQETGTSIPPSVLREELRLDQPFWPATFAEFKNVLHGDFGSSILSKQPIKQELVFRAKNTFKLALSSLTLGLSIGFLLALFSIYSRAIDRICSFLGAFTSALPTTWIGPIFAWVFGVWLHWFEISGSWVLPSLVLSLGISGVWSRLVRERLRSNYQSMACQAARARGVSEPVILLKYAIAPVSGVLLSYLGGLFASVFTGTFITELLFNWPGLGSMLIESILKRDYPVVETTLFITASISLCFHRLGDGLQYFLNRKKGLAL